MQSSKLKNTSQNSKFFEKVYEVVRQIPGGKIMTYGQIAEKVNSLSLRNKITPRLVGMALHSNPDPKTIPCHRVVDRNGKLAKSYTFGGWKEQREKLLAEGIKFRDSKHVDLEKSLWKIPTV